MAINPELQSQIAAVAASLRKVLYGPKGYPPWRTKFVDMENETGEVGDALACEMLSQYLHEQAARASSASGCCDDGRRAFANPRPQAIDRRERKGEGRGAATVDDEEERERKVSL